MAVMESGSGIRGDSFFSIEVSPASLQFWFKSSTREFDDTGTERLDGGGIRAKHKS
jgi:hypothetical protein